MHESILNTTSFFIRLLKNIGVPARVIHSADEYQESPYSTSACKVYGTTPEKVYHFLTKKMEPQMIYHEIDFLQCHHYLMLLPVSNQLTFLLIGPIRSSRLTDSQLLQRIELPQLSLSEKALIQTHYHSLSKELNIDTIEGLLYGYGQEIFGKKEKLTQQNYTLTDVVHRKTESDITLTAADSKSIVPSLTVDELYAVENKLLDYIKSGNARKVEQFFSDAASRFSFVDMEMRTPDTIRNYKNGCIIQNTLYRKAAEQGGVPPIYIHRISSDFAARIEQLTSAEEAMELARHMSRKYALLVQNRSIKEYSLPVQRIITLIDTDLTADLSLKRFSSELNQNASYLSTLFKKETGVALTDYVNSKRIEHALFLLNTTDLQIQTIANSCGIYDLSYFGKLFKKYVNMSPGSYRRSIR